MLIEILVDDRESRIIPELKTCNNRKGFNITVKRLSIGDYAFYYGDKLLVCIERKSWCDLAASITDGRKENIKKMLTAREESGCKLVYLIEGNQYLTCKPKLPKTRIPYKNLKSHLDHIAIRDGIIIIRSKDYNDTANRIVDFAENYCTLPEMVEMFKIPIGGDIKTEKIVTKHIAKDDATTTISIWKCIAGITDITHNMLHQKYDIQDFILGNIDIDELADMKYDSGMALGKKKAIKLIKSAKQNKTHIKMLSKIRGITKEAAEELLNVFKLQDVAKGNISSITIANHKRKKRRLGKLIADRVIKQFLAIEHKDISICSESDDNYNKDINICSESDDYNADNDTD